MRPAIAMIEIQEKKPKKKKKIRLIPLAHQAGEVNSALPISRKDSKDEDGEREGGEMEGTQVAEVLPGKRGLLRLC